MWDLGLVIKDSETDLNESQSPKYTLFCRENAFVVIYALSQTTNVPFLPSSGERGGRQKGILSPFFTQYLYQGFPRPKLGRLFSKETNFPLTGRGKGG